MVTMTTQYGEETWLTKMLQGYHDNRTIKQ